MKKNLFVLFIALCTHFSLFAQYYEPDILGDEYMQHTYILPDDYHGKVTATLIKKPAKQASRRAILYIHGYNDYFFQKEMGRHFTDSCYNFYALDLRKYGRSIHPEQYAFEVRNINEYYAEIDSAIYTISNEGNDKIILMGHSTGGLITSLYCQDRRENLPVDALILNSPFLEWNYNAFFRNILIPIVAWIGRYAPDWSLPDATQISPYGQSLLKEYHGEWNFDTQWKKLMSQGERLGWIRAIDCGHERVHQGLDIPCPILLMHSDKSTHNAEWCDEYQNSDAVLDVEHIALYGKNLGKEVTPIVIKNGMHDLILSKEEVRNNVYTQIFDWLKLQNLTPYED